MEGLGGPQGHRAAHALPLGGVSPQLPPAAAILESRLVGKFSGEVRTLDIYVKYPDFKC